MATDYASLGYIFQNGAWYTRQGTPLIPSVASNRQIATRCMLPVTLNNSFQQQMSASSHKALSDVDSVTVVFPNFYLVAGQEVGPGASATYTAAIEKLDGTLAQVTFNGSTTGTAANGGMVTGTAQVSLRRGETFYVRCWRSCSAGILFGAHAYNTINPTDGVAAGGTGVDSKEFFNLGATVPDQTMSTTRGTNAGTYMFRPVVIAGVSQRPAIFAIGDSKLVGSPDVANFLGSGIGSVARCLEAAQVAHSISAVQSETLYNYTSNATYNATALVQRLQLAQYFTDILMTLGVNDFINASRTSANFLSDLNIFCGLWTIPVYAATVMPVSTSTDGYATTANQTTHTSNPQRTAANDAIRCGNTGTGAQRLAGFFDMADAVETARNSGIWKIGSPLYTTDGIHETQSGGVMVAKSGVLDPRVFGA